MALLALHHTSCDGKAEMHDWAVPSALPCCIYSVSAGVQLAALARRDPAASTKCLLRCSWQRLRRATLLRLLDVSCDAAGSAGGARPCCIY